MKYALISLVGLAWLCGCAVPQPQSTQARAKLLTDPVTGRYYYLFVPNTYRRGKPAPVIVSCHGTDPFDTAVLHKGEWKWLAEQHGCILVCPKLVSTDGIFGTGAIGALLEDEKLIMSIIGELHYLYDIDRQNVMITGFSGGGFPVYFVGLRHPDVFTAVVARNCNFNRNAVDGWYPPEARATPGMVYYGENDPGTIRAQSENGIKYFRAAGFNLTTAVVPGAGHERTPEYAMKFFLERWRGGPPPPFRVPPNSKVSSRLNWRSGRRGRR